MPTAFNLAGLSLSAEQAKWKRVARQVATEALAANAAETDRSGDFPRNSLKAVSDAGLLATTVPTALGGPGQGILTTSLILEELAHACASTAMVYCMHISTVPLLAALASTCQRDRFILPLLAGQSIGALAMSEPGSGNRIWHMDSFAVAKDDGYIIDSLKSFCTGSGEVDYYLVPVRASAQSGPNDLSLFYIDGRDPNIVPIGKWDGMGLRGNNSRPIHFKGCFVSAEGRLGGPTCGFAMLFAYSLPIYQVGLSSVYLGIAQAAYDATILHVKKRIHTDTGKSLAQTETVQRYIADMKVRLDGARTLVHRVAQMADNATVLFNELHSADLLESVVRKNPDDPFFMDLATIKIAACEATKEIVDLAMQVCGGAAYKRGHPVERCYRDARAGPIMAPSDDALRLIIGRQVLGLSQPWN